MPTSLFARRHAGRSLRSRRTGQARSRQARLAIDRLESRIALAIDTLTLGTDQTVGSFTDFTGDQVLVSITGTAGTAVFRDAGGGIVDNGDNIASITITGASPDFQLTVGATLNPSFTEISPLINGFDTVYLGRVTADSVIRGINTVRSDGFIPGGAPSVARSDMIRFSLESFVGVDFSKGGGLFVDRVTGGEVDGEENVGILLAKGFSPYTTIAIREELDAVVVLGAENKGTADGRLLIESATADSIIFVNNAGSTGGNSKLEILGGEGPFDAGVAFRGPFAGTVNLQSPAGATWLFEGDVGPSAVLQAASWNGQTAGDDLPPGVVAYRSFAGTLNSTTGDASLTIGGAVKGTARINAGGRVNLVAQSVEAGAEINSENNTTLDVARTFAGRVSGDYVSATVGGNVAGATMSAASTIYLDVAGSITNSTLTALYGLEGLFPGRAVGGNISNSTLRAGTDEIDLDIGGNVVNSRLIADGDVRCRIDGSVSRSEFTAARRAAELAIAGTMTSSLVDAYHNVSLDVDGTVSKSKVFYGDSRGFETRPDLVLDVGGDLLTSEVVGRNARVEANTIVNVARDARGVQFASRVSDRGERRYTIGRNFQGSIQGASADVFLDVGGAVLKGSSLVTGGNAEVNVARNFDGVVNVDALQFRVQGNVAKDSRIVASGVRDWQVDFNAIALPPNFFVGGRFDGIVNVGVFDAAPGDVAVTILNGGAGTSARVYVGRFWNDAIAFKGDFKGNIRVLQDLVVDLDFTGSLQRITIGGQVLSDITVGGTLQFLNSNSWFQPTGPGKRTGSFLSGSLRTTGTLTTGSYVTVVPVAPPLG